MATRLPGTPFRVFLQVALVGHLVYFVPTLTAFLLFDPQPVWVVILTAHAVVTIPLSTALAWLIARGSNWANTSMAMTLIGSVPAIFYCLLLGGVLGFRLFGARGSWVGGILMVLVAYLIRRPVGRLVTQHFLPTVPSANNTA